MCLLLVYDKQSNICYKKSIKQAFKSIVYFKNINE